MQLINAVCTCDYTLRKIDGENLFLIKQHVILNTKEDDSWCGREDSNFHGLTPTATSTLRVYQFRHDRTILF